MQMGMHSFEELIVKWEHGRLTTEQMIGQMLQHLGVVYERLRLMERKMGSIVLEQATTAATAVAKDEKRNARKEA
jgi:hypothetical protein